jgi:hypothetical protein
MRVHLLILWSIMEFYTYRQHLTDKRWRRKKELVLNEIENLKKGISWPIINTYTNNIKKDKFTKLKSIQTEQVPWWMLYIRIRLKDQVAYVDNFV